MKNIDEKFTSIFKYMGIPKEQLRPETSFVKDFGFEEFQFNYLVFYLGSYFKINIRETDYAELNTIGSTMDFVRRKISSSTRLKISRRKIRPVETLKSIPRIFHLSTGGMTIMTLPQFHIQQLSDDSLVFIVISNSHTDYSDL